MPQHVLIAQILISEFFFTHWWWNAYIIEGIRLVGGDVAYDVVLDKYIVCQKETGEGLTGTINGRKIF